MKLVGYGLSLNGFMSYSVYTTDPFNKRVEFVSNPWNSFDSFDPFN